MISAVRYLQDEPPGASGHALGDPRRLAVGHGSGGLRQLGRA